MAKSALNCMSGGVPSGFALTLIWRTSLLTIIHAAPNPFMTRVSAPMSHMDWLTSAPTTQSAPALQFIPHKTAECTVWQHMQKLQSWVSRRRKGVLCSFSTQQIIYVINIYFLTLFYLDWFYVILFYCFYIIFILLLLSSYDDSVNFNFSTPCRGGQQANQNHVHEPGAAIGHEQQCTGHWSK